MNNPFPERGVATKKTFYFPYWKRTQRKFDEFLNNLKDSEKAIDFSQFLVVTGDYGSGKTATLYYMEDEIKSDTDIKALILSWQLSTPIKKQTVVQSFYNDFIHQLQKFFLNDESTLNILGAAIYSEMGNFIDDLEIPQRGELVDLLKEYHDFKFSIDPTDETSMEELRNKFNEIVEYLDEITGRNFVLNEIQALEKLLIEGMGFIPSASAQISEGEIKSNMQKILEVIREKYDYECIILLIDEFDILIRNIKADLPEEVLKKLRDFFTWFDPQSFKGYHIAGAMYVENIERLQTEANGSRIDSIFRRLLIQIRLDPIPKFENFHDNLYLQYLEKNQINVNFELFDRDYLKFIFFSCKKNFGTILAILNEQFSSWQDEIENFYQRFLNKPSRSKVDIELQQLIWNEKGLSKHFSKKFIEIVEDNDKINRKFIFTYLVRHNQVDDLAPDYEAIKNDLGLNHKRIVLTFHDELTGVEQFKQVFPVFDEHFYIAYDLSYRIFNLSGIGATTSGPVVVGPVGIEDESKYYTTFMQKYTQRGNTDTHDKDWTLRINFGFQFLIEDFLTNNPNPFENLFETRPDINKGNLKNFIHHNGSQSLLQNFSLYEANLKHNFMNDFDVNYLTVEIKSNQNTILNQFLMIFLPVTKNYRTEIDDNFINLMKEILDNVNYNNNNFDALVIFSNFTIDFNEVERLTTESDTQKPWVHLIDRIILISLETTTSILKNKDETIFLSKRTPFTFFCAAFDKMHTSYPQGETKTYYDLLFSPANNDQAESNMLLLQKLLTHVFETYNSIFKTISHNRIEIERKKRNDEEYPDSNIQQFPAFIFNISSLLNCEFPIDESGLVYRQSLDVPFKIGSYTIKDLEQCLDDLSGPSFVVTSSERRSSALTKKFSVLSTLIEMNFIKFSENDTETKFFVRNDMNSLLNAFEIIVQENTQLNQPFNGLDLDLDCCTEKSKAIYVLEKFLDFLVANRKIFNYYEETN